MRIILKRVAGYLLYSVILYVVLAYIAGMPMRWSIVLALVITSIERRLLHITKPERRFTPFYLNVIPHWGLILSDYRLVDSDETGKRFRTVGQQILAPSTYSFAMAYR